MDKDNLVYLKLMLDSFNKIRSYIAGMMEEDFKSDSKTQSAVIMQLQVIGEVAKKIPDEVKQLVDIPWKQIIGMRDMVSHDYFSLDVKSIWDTIVTSAPEAENKIMQYVQASAPTPDPTLNP